MTLPDERPSVRLHRLMNGSQGSQAIHVAATLGIAALRRDGPRSAGLLMLMPRARGLVHKVIQQSIGMASQQTPESADGVMRCLLAGAGLSPAQAGQLRDMPAAALLDLQQRITPRTGGNFYRPVCDGDLIPADHLTAVATGASRGIPLLCGTNLDEMKFFRGIRIT
jgi:para-nitrobenzyl esterase